MVQSFSSLGSKDCLPDAVADDMCVELLAYAEECRRVAKTPPASGPDNQSAHITISRAYCAIHYSLRAMSLWKNKRDPEGHEESITEFKMLLQDNHFLHVTGLTADDWERVVEARENGRIADYDSSKLRRDLPDPCYIRASDYIRLTDQDWADAGRFNIKLADDIFQAALRYVGL